MSGDIVKIIREVLGDRLRAIIVFGSTVYLGSGRDVDMLVVTNSDIDEKLRTRFSSTICAEIIRRLKITPNICIMSYTEFLENLAPGTFLSGLALGYIILYGDGEIESFIMKFLERLSKEQAVLHNRYGSWNLSYYARIQVSRKHRAS